MTINTSQAIGILDSGIGGLTVAKEIIKLLPNEQIIYIGDTARVPYGVRGKNVITSFALELSKFLLQQNVKVLVVACNTISATCMKDIKNISPVPVIGVIEPTIEHVLSYTKNNTIGVIGTPATINSKIYEKNITKSLPNATIISQSCPMFVPLVEEGLFAHPATKLLSKEYLSKFDNKNIDTLILGCTHYPLLIKIIKEVIGKQVTIIDSAKPTAIALSKLLKKENLLSDIKDVDREFYFTDVTEKEHAMMDILFGEHIPYKVLSTELIVNLA